MMDFKGQLMNIGKDIASLWNAICYDCSVFYTSKQVEFYCMESGMTFPLIMSFDEIKTRYGIILDHRMAS